MSAITGIYNFNRDFVEIEHGDRLMAALRKYPADSIHTWYGPNIFLGCHAQWITPESIDEQLPYYDPESRLAITADAIIDNREELFAQLQVEHARRKAMPDSRLILLAYQKWGEEAPKYLVGDFAFMIWDERKRLLFGARDFSGSRTLYYCRTGESFTFSTIIQPLFSLPHIEKKINEQWLSEFLAITGMFETVDPCSTVYHNIEQVPPSHSVTVAGGKVKLTQYCRITAGESLKLKSDQEYEEAFREVFGRAVKDRLRTHHQVGAQLSGGLDSGSVVSFAARALSSENKKLHTFSYIPVEGFQDWTPRNRMADERPYIRSTIEHVGNISDYYLDFQGRSPLTEIDDWLETQEMPYKFAENSYWLKGIYEKGHEHGIGIMLNGQRGNWTVSWGPALDYQAALLKKLRLFRLYRELNQYSANIGVKKSRLLPVIGMKAFPALYERLRSKKNLYHFPLLISPEFASKTNVYDKLQQHKVDLAGNSVPNAYEARMKQFEDLVYWSINGTFGTKLSLRYRLWDRDPTNDLRVVRFSLSVPEEQYVRNGMDRALIRRSTAALLPDKVRLNQKLRGIQGADGIYRMTAYWSSFIGEVEQLSKDPAVSGYLNTQTIDKALHKFRENPKPEDIYDADFKILIRSLIFYRFMKKHA